MAEKEEKIIIKGICKALFQNWIKAHNKEKDKLKLAGNKSLIYYLGKRYVLSFFLKVTTQEDLRTLIGRVFQSSAAECEKACLP